MNLSLQIGRGLVALALCVALSAYAMTRAPTASLSALPTMAASSVSAIPVRATRAHVAHRGERCETSAVIVRRSI
ncbi:MAG: hypothetical protein ACREPT_12880 [Rudaea sp.]